MEAELFEKYPEFSAVVDHVKKFQNPITFVTRENQEEIDRVWLNMFELCPFFKNSTCLQCTAHLNVEKQKYLENQFLLNEVCRKKQKCAPIKQNLHLQCR